MGEKHIKEILRCFAIDLTASDTAELMGVSRGTINKVFNKIRCRIFELSLGEQALGEYEVDESYFGARRVRGKRGRGAAGKTPVFGILKRGEAVRVSIVKNCSKAELLPIIKGIALEGSTIHSDKWKAYDGLILNGYDHYRVHHGANEFVRGKCHVNGIESFWSFAKRRLAKFNGLTDKKFYLHLKECEFRFNHRADNLYLELLAIFKKNPL